MVNIELAKLRWACRRGMLELDLIFENYVNHYYLKASATEQQAFKSLLECNDQELFNWLVKRETPEPQYANMVSTLLGHVI